MKISRESKIGLVATIAVLVAIWGISFLKGINVFKPTDTYYAVYGNVKGLVESANIYLNGYKVGNVKKIEFDKDRIDQILVEISLDQKLKLPENTALVLQSASLISGTKDLEIRLGEGPGTHESGDTLRSVVEVELSDYIDPIRAQVQSLVTTIDTLMSALNSLMDSRTRQNLQGTIANLNGATSALKLSLQAGGDLNHSMGNLKSVTENLKNNNEKISSMLQNLASVSDSLKQSELKALIQHADMTFASTSEIFAKMARGEGTAGKLMVNDSLYRNLNSALASMDSLLIDLREHPKRYVHLSVFGKKDK